MGWITVIEVMEALYRSSASLKPENCQRACGGKKLRYVTRS
jgi:hypothetical protein